MTTFTTYTTDQVAQAVTTLGYSVLTIDQASEDADAMVWLTADLGVQIGSFGGLSVDLYEGYGDNFGVRQWDCALIEKLPATLATAEVAVGVPVWIRSRERAGAASALEAAVRRLLRAHQEGTDDERRAALAHLRFVVNS